MQDECTMLSSVVCSALQHFSTSLINGAIFVKTLLNIKYLFSFSLQLLSEIFLVVRRIQRDMIMTIHVEYSYSTFIVILNFIP